MNDHTKKAENRRSVKMKSMKGNTKIAVLCVTLLLIHFDLPQQVLGTSHVGGQKTGSVTFGGHNDNQSAEGTKLLTRQFSSSSAFPRHIFFATQRAAANTLSVPLGGTSPYSSRSNVTSPFPTPAEGGGETPEQGPQNRSSSSGSPASAQVEELMMPKLEADLHKWVTPEELEKVTALDLIYSRIDKSHCDELQKLHKEWFPVDYGSSFFKVVCSGDMFTLGAFYRTKIGQPLSSSSRDTPSSETAKLPTAASPGDNASPKATNDTGYRDFLVGAITVAPRRITDDVEVICRNNPSVPLWGDSRWPSSGSLAEDDREENVVDRNGMEAVKACHCLDLPYVLTMGVADEMRRKGVAKGLLRRALEHYRHVQLKTSAPVCCNAGEAGRMVATYLHVVEYNEPAIRLYESVGFRRLMYIPDFYKFLGGKHGGYLYAYYYNDDSKSLQNVVAAQPPPRGRQEQTRAQQRLFRSSSSSSPMHVGLRTNSSVPDGYREYTF